MTEEPLWQGIVKTWLESKNIPIHQELQRLKNLVITIFSPPLFTTGMAESGPRRDVQTQTISGFEDWC